jgi:TRAP-type mannitol/chloroaromatic compound transport system permease large subunit
VASKIAVSSSRLTKSITPPDITMTQIYRATLPYLWLTIVATAIVTGWPGLSLWLPKLLLRH